jgi:hypothetical protein
MKEYELRITIEDKHSGPARWESGTRLPCHVKTLLILPDPTGAPKTRVQVVHPDPVLGNEAKARTAALDLLELATDLQTPAEVDWSDLQSRVEDCLGVAELINFRRGCYD